MTTGTLVPVFAALGDETRWSILAALGEGDASLHWSRNHPRMIDHPFDNHGSVHGRNAVQIAPASIECHVRVLPGMHGP